MVDDVGEALGPFRLALNEALLGCASLNPDGRDLACHVSGELSRRDAAWSPVRRPGRADAHAHGSDCPALRHWQTAIAHGRSKQAWVASLCGCLDELRPHLPWYRRPEPDLPGFMAGHANAVLMGHGGLVESKCIRIGLTLMAPHTVYPDHHHPPAEGYVVLSEGEWRQEQGPWKAPGVGGWVYNPPDIVHAMRSGPQPLLAIWCLLLS